MNAELLYIKEFPFHEVGTAVFEEADGTLVYECPHCGCRPVPRLWAEELRRYAAKRVKA
jgi:hypothetical protein